MMFKKDGQTWFDTELGFSIIDLCLDEGLSITGLTTIKGMITFEVVR
jgi:hypothetical protein